MPRRALSPRAAVAAATALLLLGAAGPALAEVATEPGTVCVLTDYDPKTGERKGLCVWVPMERPFTG